MNDTGAIAGAYEGSGNWHDSAGESRSYSVVHSIRRLNAGFEVTFKHVFDDAPDVEAHFVMHWIAPHIFRVQIMEKPIGHGYMLQNLCHYHLEVAGAFVEASYRATAEGLQVHGSSTKNAEGRYIAWHETLRRKAE